MLIIQLQYCYLIRRWPSGTIVLSGAPFDAYDVISCVQCILCSMASIKGNDDDDDEMILGSYSDPANSTSKYSDLLLGRKCLPGHSLSLII